MEEYEEYEEYEEGGGSVNRILIIVIVLLLLAIAAGCVYFFFIRRDPGPESDGLGYDANVGVALTQEELDAAMREAMKNAAGGGIALKYQNGAYSDDGKNFSCYILNSEKNLYDMFIGIYADPQLTDRLFLSGLIPRGSGYDRITLDRALEKGTHTVYVELTQVKRDEDGNETAGKKITHTMDFHVS